MVYKIKKQSERVRRPSKSLLIGGAILLVGATVLAILELTNTTYIFHSKPVAKTAPIPATTQKPKTNPGSDKSTPTTSTPETPPVAGDEDKGTSDTTPGTSAPSGAAPDTPSGTFLSNHKPNLDGDPYPSQVQSICTTTPGATCSMTFVNGGLTRTLSEQRANNDGNAFWTWDVKQAGFTTGKWTVTVTATLNGQTKTAQDSLEVGP